MSRMKLLILLVCLVGVFLGQNHNVYNRHNDTDNDNDMIMMMIMFRMKLLVLLVCLVGACLGQNSAVFDNERNEGSPCYLTLEVNTNTKYFY